MRSFFLIAVIAFLSMGLITTEASAARFGFSRHKSFSTLTSKSSQFGKNRLEANRRHGFFRGLLMGGLLASLFMGHGIAGSLLVWMLLTTVVLFMINKFKRRS